MSPPDDTTPPDKPYRVYKARRGKPRLPAVPGLRRRRGTTPPPSEPRLPGARAPRPRRRFRPGRWFAVLVGAFLLFCMAWSLASFFTFRDGVTAANDRLSDRVRAQLDEQDKLLLTNSTTILLLGTDHDRGGSRRGLRHSDSIMLVRTDPDHHRIYYLSIPRDLHVPIPGVGSGRINTAFQAGGAPLSVRTVRQLTGLDVHHAVIVDFARFEKLIDTLGGIEIDVPAPIQSSRFDCPLKTATDCASWPGWRFAKGEQHMDGRRALVYSRIRENQLDAADNDVTRAERQQQVLQAIAGKLASFATFIDLPFVGDDLLAPLATDLEPGQFLQLGWVYWRSSASKAVHCRLGGSPETIGGASVIRPSEDNRAVIAMFQGESAPQPPPPGSGTYGPGCVIGNAKLGSR